MECWEKRFVRAIFPYSASRMDIDLAYRLKDPHVPPKLYKYRSFQDAHLDALRRGVLWLSAPERFNDPYDSTIYFDTSGFFTEDLSVGDAVAKFEKQELDERSNRWKPEDLRNPITQREWIKRVTDELLRNESPETRQAVRKALEAFQHKTNLEMVSKMTAFLRKGMSVLSLSRNPTSALMWSHYSDSHRGFCIEYDFDSLPADDLRRRLCYPVIYRHKLTNATRYLPIKKPQNFNNLFGKLLCLLKSDVWAYEKEWRIVHAIGPDLANREMQMPKPSAIIIGSQTRDADRATLEGICTNMGLQLKQATQQPETFSIDIVDYR